MALLLLGFAVVRGRRIGDRLRRLHRWRNDRLQSVDAVLVGSEQVPVVARRSLQPVILFQVLGQIRAGAVRVRAEMARVN